VHQVILFHKSVLVALGFGVVFFRFMKKIFGYKWGRSLKGMFQPPAAMVLFVVNCLLLAVQGSIAFHELEIEAFC